ncbi:hypothetical protein BKA64DRAFT_638059 [Cadophora sp. MPI-SDFR-AT-0126]|nr:hypothetical protein BKA64DRAFT_638059 [Leotiomycetes sp. MPI-SDFR-AT-0126]
MDKVRERQPVKEVKVINRCRGKENVIEYWKSLPMLEIAIMYQIIMVRDCRKGSHIIKVHRKIFELWDTESEHIRCTLDQWCPKHLNTCGLWPNCRKLIPGLLRGITPRCDLEFATKMTREGWSLDSRLVTLMLDLFNLSPRDDDELELAHPQPDTAFGPFSRLPIELQMKTLDYLPLSMVEMEIRLNHPRLIPRWLASLPTRFYEWYDQFCHRDNLRYAGQFSVFIRRPDGTLVMNELEIYRSRMIDFRPWLHKRRYNGHWKDTAHTSALPIVDVVVLEDTHSLPYHLERLFWRLKQGATRTDSCLGLLGSWKMDVLGCKSLLCDLCKSPIPLMIPLNYPEPIGLHEPSRPFKPDQYLLIFQDELMAVFSEMETVFRPLIFAHRAELKECSSEQTKLNFLMMRKEIVEWTILGWWAIHGCYNRKLCHE